MLIYIGTPMAAVGLWKREDIDRVEASLYRKILRIDNNTQGGQQQRWSRKCGRRDERQWR
jgi:hypothetical protein